MFSGFELFAIPKSIKALIAAQEFSQVKDELIKLIPAALFVFAFCAAVLGFLFIVYILRRCGDFHAFYSRRRVRRFQALLHGLLLDLRLGRDLTSSPVIEEVRKVSHSWFIRRRLQKENFGGIQECLERIGNSELDRGERAEIVVFLIRMAEVIG